ncbi:SPOR domain-containing protein [Photobacterium sp. Alg240-V54]|uniref:SPOR domain-containing protein n=1 Tax=Photobacterium sp. Alg240-V54 TaxID=2305995 RepID=UPI0013CFAD3D|nr:SPOR domain-containing protein [Photobacterium sp. Alg240-V54]
MKKIIALSLLSSLVGCAQLMPPKTPLQTPMDTINTTKMTDNFSEPKVVAELDASVKTDPLYQSIDSIAVSEQQIEAPAPAAALEPEAVAVEPAVEPTAVNNEAAIVTDAAQSNPATSIDNAEVTSATAVEPAVEATAANNEAAIVTDSTDNAEVAPAATPSEPAAVEPTAAMTEPVSEATPETTVVEEAPQTNEDGYKTVDMHGYSIQITTSRDEPSLVALLSLLESQQPAWVNKKMLTGSQVYTLLLGHYADYDQAKAALIALPQAVQNNGAFVRNFYDIEHTGSPQLKQLQ